VGEDAAEDKVGVGTPHAQRDDDVSRLKRAEGCLGQHRREEHEVLAADDRRSAAAELARDVGVGEAAAGDQRPAPCFQIRHVS
jgi:hypothetical protein